MEQRLRYILSTVNEWLKFAEAKNGALLAADIAILLGLFSLLDDSRGSELWTYLAIFLLTISAISTLVSFIPKLKVQLHPAKKSTETETNLIFFGHIAKYEPESYVKALYSASGAEMPIDAPIELYYAQEIITNSRIALRKYLCFNIGLWLTMIALLTLFVAALAAMRG